MGRAISLTCVLLAVAAAPARAAETSEAAALQAAEAWLKLIDTGQYGASWDEASASFRKAVSRSLWEKKAAAAREPLGKVLSRKVSSKQLTHELPRSAGRHLRGPDPSTRASSTRSAGSRP
jgi:hypothetical protein